MGATRFVLALAAALAAAGNLGALAADDSTILPTPPSKTNYTDVIYHQTGCGRGLLGGYFPVDDLNSTQLRSYASLALRDYLAASPPLGGACSPDLAAARESIRVDAACSQVVAGTNYVIAFGVEIPCRKGLAVVATQQEELLAEVFVPLPYTNAPPQVRSVERIG